MLFNYHSAGQNSRKDKLIFFKGNDIRYSFACSLRRLAAIGLGLKTGIAFDDVITGLVALGFVTLLTGESVKIVIGINTPHRILQRCGIRFAIINASIKLPGAF